MVKMNTEISKISSRISEANSKLKSVNSDLINSNTASKTQSLTLEKIYLEKVIKSNLKLIPRLMYVPIHRVVLELPDGKHYIHHISNVSEQDIVRIFELMSSVYGYTIKILEIKKLPSQVQGT